MPKQSCQNKPVQKPVKKCQSVPRESCTQVPKEIEQFAIDAKRVAPIVYLYVYCHGKKKIFIFIRCQESQPNSLSLSLSGAERVVPVGAKGELPIGASAEANQGFVLIFCF